jgi:hypothetical protein
VAKDANRGSQGTRVVVDTSLGRARDTTSIVWSKNGSTDGLAAGAGLGAQPGEASYCLRKSCVLGYFGTFFGG